MNSLKKFLFFIISIIVVLSCSKDNDESNNSNTSENQLDDKTVIINSATDNLLAEVGESKLVFSSANEQIDNIKVGSILASDITGNAPNGYLRKVISIQNSGGNIIVNTAQSSLAEAIKNVDFSYKYAIGNEHVIAIDDSGEDITTGKMTNTSKGFNNSGSTLEITIPFKGKEIYTQGKDKITLDGSIKITFDVDFNLKIENNSLKEFSLIQNVKGTADATLLASIENLPQISKQQVLRVISLAPITVPILGLPVPIAKQWIVVAIGIDGKISAGFEVGTKDTYTISAGIVYNETSGWDTIFDTNNEYEPSQSEVFATGGIEGWIQARYEVRPYGLSNSRIFIANKTGPKLSGGFSSVNPELLDLSLDWCIESNAKAQMVVFDRAIVDYNVDIYNQCFNVTSWSNKANAFIGNWKAIIFQGRLANGTYYPTGYYQYCSDLAQEDAWNNVFYTFKGNDELILETDRSVRRYIIDYDNLVDCNVNSRTIETSSFNNTDSWSYKIINDEFIEIDNGITANPPRFSYKFINETELHLYHSTGALYSSLKKQ